MKRLLSLLLVFVIVFAGCASTYEAPADTNVKEKGAGEVATEEQAEEPKTVTITHKFGTVTVPFNPTRVVVPDMGALDIMDVFGLEDNIVGVVKKNLPSYLSNKYKSDKYTALGSLKELDLEAIYALKPDCIIISGRQSGYYDQLSEIAPVVFCEIDREREYMDYFSDYLNTVAKIFGKEAETQQYIDDFNARLETINKKVTENGYTTLVTILSSRTLKALGANTRCSLIYNEAGFTNLGEEFTPAKHGDATSFEYVVDINPDFLFVVDKNSATGKTEYEPAVEQLENELVKTTKAYKNGNIVYLNPREWYLVECGLTSTDRMIADLEDALK